MNSFQKIIAEFQEIYCTIVAFKPLENYDNIRFKESHIDT